MVDGEFVFFIWSNLQNAVQCCTRSSCLESSYPQIVRYCECFAGGIYCDGCKCANCYNDVENEDVRIAAIEGILERNPSAFKPKIANSPLKTLDNRDVCVLECNNIAHNFELKPLDRFNMILAVR
ncbi:protein tesmin/tso1-like cxc 6 [Quercus suber]|uniref:Protein tesmin/tso1-like cxc 6 n=1 Tax=Quercus suber TaxID=58331 RepID=A0AAW0KIW2_QUESU